MQLKSFAGDVQVKHLSQDSTKVLKQSDQGNLKVKLVSLITSNLPSSRSSNTSLPPELERERVASNLFTPVDSVFLTAMEDYLTFQ